MARVKICGSCGTHNVPARPFCAAPGCGSSLGDVDIVDSTPDTAQPPSEPQAVRSDDRQSYPPRATWRGDAVPGEIAAVLTFPWGDVDVGDAMFVGRDRSFSTLADRLEGDGYFWVSAKHAEIYTEDDKLHVRDMGSMNGTYVNGTRIDNRPVALCDGDSVSFSRRLVAIVRIGTR